MEEISTRHKRGETTVTYSVAGLQIIQGCSQGFIDPRLQAIPMSKEDLNQVVCAAHVTSIDNGMAAIREGCWSFREECLARRAALYDERG